MSACVGMGERAGQHKPELKRDMYNDMDNGGRQQQWARAMPVVHAVSCTWVVLEFDSRWIRQEPNVFAGRVCENAVT